MAQADERMIGGWIDEAAYIRPLARTLRQEGVTARTGRVADRDVPAGRRRGYRTTYRELLVAADDLERAKAILRGMGLGEIGQALTVTQ
ncbi:MAG: hypothetical protein R6V58_12970 [Planctomycetota bacterium]